MRDFSIKRRNKSYQIFGILLLCISLIALVSNITIAWFRDESVTSNGDSVTIIGTLGIDVTTNFNFYNLALAPDKIYTTDKDNQRIGTYLQTSEDHDIEGAYVRIKFETDRRNIGTITYIDNTDLLNLYFDGNLTTNTTYSASEKNKWFYNSADGYYYYIGAIEDSEVCFNAGYKTSNYMTNVESNAEVRLVFTVEAIQRQYGAYLEIWTTAPNIFVEWAEEDEVERWGQQPSTN